MQAGKLRYNITIQEKTVTQDEAGEEQIVWTKVAKVAASVDPLRGREYFDAALNQAEVSHRVTIRYRAGVLPTMRLLYGARVFEIESVIDVGERHRELQLMCREVPDG